MAVLTQDQRIAISKKFLELPIAISKADETIAILEGSKDAAYDLDQTHKALVDDETTIINPYQKELSYISGNLRLELTEQMIEDSAKRVQGNYFFPNDPTITLPSVDGNIWKFLPPFGGNIAEGKAYNESYNTVNGEANMYTSIMSIISSIEGGYSNVERVTGNSCLMDNVAVNTTLHGLKNILVTFVNNYKAALTQELSGLSSQLLVDSDVTNNNNTTAAQNDINNNIMPAINTWLAYVDFDPQTAMTCAAFNSININTLLDTKLKPNMLNALKTALNTRVSFRNTRTTQLNIILGSVGQDYTTGEMDNTGSGRFDKRFKLINLRLNAISGSLPKYYGILKGIEVQNAIKANNQQSLDTYATIMSCSGFRSPSVGTNIIHVMDGSLFSAGNSVYVVTDDHEELSGQVTAVNGNAITINITIPQKYTKANFGRLYKML